MSAKVQHAKEKGLDHSLDALREGNLYIFNRRHSFQSDVFETRLLGQKAICMGGEEAAELFYDTEKFKRHGVAPGPVKKTLLGKNSVQTLDGEAHRHRKDMFMSLMTPDRLKKMDEIVERQWVTALDAWEGQKQTVLYEEAKLLLMRAACEWAGVPLWATELKQRTADVSAMFEGPATVRPKHFKARKARERSEDWIRGLVEQVRGGELFPDEDTALFTMAWHEELDGNLMDTHTAAVEILNIIRPIVAISIYISFTALAVLHYPEEREELRAGKEGHQQMFVQEVRRYYPFFPFQAAKVKESFDWKGVSFKKGTLVLLDFYGTNHDPKLWENPEQFNPERFADWEESPFSFLPQGGGDYMMGHRCPGEWITIRVMKIALDFLVNRMNYQVPAQELSYSMVKVPSMPASNIVLTGVKRI
ncbi:cytochrome P450 [Lentibacillus sediminis]|uniref:cytochrome P450 n=1 Tax=Lentibacillus sediminis TaxID=1940529 RepID=UPI000C1C6AE8|nr:cytochrome P450 [Lentibacillus sediminis]